MNGDCMTTFTAFSILRSKENAQALGEALESIDPEPIGVGVIELEDGSGDWEVAAYFDEEPDDIALALLSAAHQAGEFVISELPDTDWVAKVRRELKPVIAGRFFVYGSHDADKVPADSEPLLIEAAMAFGTGHHGTTMGCLRALDRLVSAGIHCKNVADIGCGTAVLAMAAARVWPETVLASDIDEVAVDVAMANAEANDLAGRLECYVAAGFSHDAIKAKAPFDLVFANILKAPLIALAPDMARYIQSGGYAILSGILVDQAQEVIDTYIEHGFSLDLREDIGEWANLTLVRG